MRTRSATNFTARRAAMLGAVLLAGTAWPALAQPMADPTPETTAPQDAPATAQSDPQEDEIVVSGYRASLASSTNAKKNSTGFTDTIFAEDIGKFPDTNIAESFNRIPGVTISREVTGEGLNVTIRGLGTNFTRVLLNGAPVAVASTGRTDAQNTNREVDLDLFPTELFTQLTVSKSGVANMVEGGAAGTVNMRSARPFDKPGMHFTYGGQLTKNTNADKWGYRGSLLGSATFGDFGILLGVAGVHNQVRTTGFETIGWTNPNLSAAQRTSGTLNPTGGGNWTIPATVPANAGNGLVTGTVIDQAFLLARNPGTTIDQIDNGIIPRLGRPMDEFGTKDRINGIASIEYKGENFHAYVDGMYGWKKNSLERIDMNWVGRNGAMIPLNTTYDRTDCATGCVVTSGTYANAQFFLEYRPHIEETRFWGINPGFDFQITDNLKIELQGNYTKSTFHRESPTVLVITPASSGVTVNYDNRSGEMPIITSNINLNNPANFGWPGGRVNIQDERRETKTKGVRGSLTWGEDRLNLQVGGAYDDVSRSIRAYDNSQNWQNAVCGNRPSVNLPGPNTQPPCNGLNQAGAAPAGYPTYPAFGTGYTAGQTGPVTYQGSLIPNSAVAGFLKPGPSGFITVDWDRFKAASNYDTFHDAAGEAGSSNTGANGGYVREKTTAAFAQVNGDLPLAGGTINFNAGLRYVRTDQTIGGRVTITDPRNNIDPDGAGPLPAACPGGGANLRDGSCYPNIVNFVYTNAKYDNWLPSANAAFHISDNAVVRAAASRTMTRPNPNTMLPGLNFSSPSADVGSVGNPSLTPYISTNFDLGFEYYTGAEGYVGFTAFRKAVTGFTTNGNVTVPFSSLATYGVTYDTLSPTQQAAINSRGGPGTATVVLTQQVNATGTLKVNGLEVNWVQPLDFLLGRYLGLNGFGFNANLTLIDQVGSGAAPAVATGVSPVTYNITGYYEHGGISTRLSYTFNRGSVSSGANQNGIPLASLYNDDYGQLDLSASVDFAEILDLKWAPQLTLDVQNLTKQKQRSYFQFENAAFTLYNPGRQVMIGLRGRF
ncbi:MAG: TonB-dependent receptor [Sphingomonas sp.]|uniref:TonB-dependent receptor n=1 Tax=Sphingomonas sp. TaxID=28214 RepID=UPI0025E31242|nr:TonB-dependent receptor [Sphingomonas sp.]MBX3563624.1 TonB-dependent receptor [Sphingomonas sp.]